jgi:ribosomal protein S3AE
MAKKIIKKKTKSKVVKKKWYNIVAPKVFNEAQVGEILLAEPEAAKGRGMRVSLMTILGDPSKQNQAVNLKLTTFSDNKYSTEITGYKLLPAAVKRMIRRNRDKVDDSFVLKTKDGKLARIKPVVVTRGKTTNSVLTAMRKYIRAYLAKYVANVTFDELIRDIIGKRMQIDLAKLLKKFHPIGIFDIRMINLVSPERAKKGINLLLPPKEVTEPEKPAAVEA